MEPSQNQHTSSDTMRQSRVPAVVSESRVFLSIIRAVLALDWPTNKC